MMLKDQIIADNAMFLDLEECGELHNIELEGVTYNIPVIIDDETSDSYEKRWDGVYLTSLTVFFCENEVPRRPIRDQIFTLDGKEYVVAKCGAAEGMLEVKLAVPET